MTQGRATIENVAESEADIAGFSRRVFAGGFAALVASIAGAAKAAATDKVARRYNPVASGTDYATTDSTYFDPNFPPTQFAHYFMSHGKPVQSFMWIADGADAKGCVILLPHAYGGDVFDSLIPAFLGAGINVLRFNPRGMYDHAENQYTFPGALDDLHAAIAFLRQNGGRHNVPPGDGSSRTFQIDLDHIAVMGCSGGGGMLSWIASAEDPKINAIIPLGPQPLLPLPLSAERVQEFAALKASTAGRIDINAALSKLTPADYKRLDMFKAAPKLANKNVLLIGYLRPEYIKTIHQPLVDAMQDATKFSQAILQGSGELHLTTRIALTRMVVSWLKNECGF